MKTNLKIITFFLKANFQQLFCIAFICYFLAQILRLTF